MYTCKSEWIKFDHIQVSFYRFRILRECKSNIFILCKLISNSKSNIYRFREIVCKFCFVGFEYSLLESKNEHTWSVLVSYKFRFRPRKRVSDDFRKCAEKYFDILGWITFHESRKVRDSKIGYESGYRLYRTRAIRLKRDLRLFGFRLSSRVQRWN